MPVLACCFLTETRRKQVLMHDTAHLRDAALLAAWQRSVHPQVADICVPKGAAALGGPDVGDAGAAAPEGAW